MYKKVTALVTVKTPSTLEVNPDFLQIKPASSYNINGCKVTVNEGTPLSIAVPFIERILRPILTARSFGSTIFPDIKLTSQTTSSTGLAKVNSRTASYTINIAKTDPIDEKKTFQEWLFQDILMCTRLIRKYADKLEKFNIRIDNDYEGSTILKTIKALTNLIKILEENPAIAQSLNGQYIFFGSSSNRIYFPIARAFIFVNALDRPETVLRFFETQVTQLPRYEELTREALGLGYKRLSADNSNIDEVISGLEKLIFIQTKTPIRDLPERISIDNSFSISPGSYSRTYYIDHRASTEEIRAFLQTKPAKAKEHSRVKSLKARIQQEYGIKIELTPSFTAKDTPNSDDLLIEILGAIYSYYSGVTRIASKVKGLFHVFRPAIATTASQGSPLAIKGGALAANIDSEYIVTKRIYLGSYNSPDYTSDSIYIDINQDPEQAIHFLEETEKAKQKFHSLINHLRELKVSIVLDDDLPSDSQAKCLEILIELYSRLHEKLGKHMIFIRDRFSHCEGESHIYIQHNGSEKDIERFLLDYYKDFSVELADAVAALLDELARDREVNGRIIRPINRANPPEGSAGTRDIPVEKLPKDKEYERLIDYLQSLQPGENPDPFRVLNLASNADKRKINEQFRRLYHMFAPDRNPPDEKVWTYLGTILNVSRDKALIGK